MKASHERPPCSRNAGVFLCRSPWSPRSCIRGSQALEEGRGPAPGFGGSIVYFSTLLSFVSHPCGICPTPSREIPRGIPCPRLPTRPGKEGRHGEEGAALNPREVREEQPVVCRTLVCRGPGRSDLHVGGVGRCGSVRPCLPGIRVQVSAHFTAGGGRGRHRHSGYIGCENEIGELRCDIFRLGLQ